MSDRHAVSVTTAHPEAGGASRAISIPGSAELVSMTERPARWPALRTPSARVAAAFFGFWGVISLVEFVDLLQQPLAGGHGLPVGLVAYITALDTFSWAMLSLSAYAITMRFPIWRSTRRHLPIFLLCAFACSLARSAFLAWLAPTHAGAFLMGIRMRFGRDVMGYVFILGTCVGVAAFVEARDRERRTLQLIASLAEARLAVLKGQLQPHFLFNTLHAISSLVRSDPPGAQRVVTKLGEMLRTTLTHRDLHEVTLREELELLQPYREIQHVRFGDRIRMELRVHDEAADALIPHLLLQPLVENAFEYGVADLGENGVVAVDAFVNASRELVLRVEDNGPGFTARRPRPRRTAGTGLGLSNARARLEQLYGDRAGVRTFDRDPDLGGAVVEIVLPFRRGAAAASA
ncbi:MAG: histidine kinase internal region [Gemmatimonadetes bacterium]|nr:histidine kinase internal region [Gemmatimonadota bacterium]